MKCKSDATPGDIATAVNALIDFNLANGCCCPDKAEKLAYAVVRDRVTEGSWRRFRDDMSRLPRTVTTRAANKGHDQIEAWAEAGELRRSMMLHPCMGPS